MKWLERFFGPSETYRRYGDNEIYEYPRNDDSSASPRWEFGPEFTAPSMSSRSWRGPSLFEDSYADMYQEIYATRGMSSNDHRGREEGRSLNSRGVSHQCVSQNGGHTSEVYNPTSGRFRDSAYGWKSEQPLAYDHHNSYTRRYKSTGDHHDTTRDDVLARTLSLRKYPGPYGTAVSQVSDTTTKSVGMSSTCAGCHRSLGFGRVLTCLTQNWHPECFDCKYCCKTILDKEFSVHGSDPYHRDCYKQLFHPKCAICHNHIPLNARGQIEYRSHPFWNQRYCPQHERDGSTRCCSCDRIEPVDQRYKRLEDGRKVCSECMESAVMATDECQDLYRDVLKFYKSTLGLHIKQEVPMLLVKREALNNARAVEKDGHTHAPETRGLCLSEEQILPVLEHGGYHMRELTRHCEVTAILVLYGLPRLLTGSILAHELMHAWLRLDGTFLNLENDIEEGICQVIAHMWLKSELDILTRRSNTGSSISKRLCEFFLHQIETDSSPIYGDGYRAASAAVAKYGLPRTLHHLRQTGEILRYTKPIPF